jgi:hypothetical protein
VAVSVVRGRPGAMAVAAAVFVARVGVHGIAGDRFPGLAVWAFLLVAIVELAAVSFEARQMPLVVDAALARAIFLAAGAGVVVGVLAPGAGLSLVTGTVQVLSGLGAAAAVATILVRLARSPAFAAGKRRS